MSSAVTHAALGRLGLVDLSRAADTIVLRLTVNPLQLLSVSRVCALGELRCGLRIAKATGRE